MLQVSSLQKSYGGQILFEDVTFSMQRKERIGLIGRNGHGKSTLFKILLGQEEADDGTITVPKGYRLGHLPQTIEFEAPTVLEEACRGLPEDEKDQQWKAERILDGLGFSERDLEASPLSFSGGFQLRINLAKLLLSEPNLLLLDEPTNYLDIVSVRWLQQELQRWPGELIIISHDREFMDSVTTHTMMIHRGKVRKAEGNTYKLENLIAESEELYAKTQEGLKKRRDEVQAFVDRFRAQASKAALVQSRIKELERMDIGEELEDIASLGFSFNEKPFESKFLLHGQDISFGYKPEELLINKLSFSMKNGGRVGVIGKNGRGKSTLLKILAGELTPNSGEVKQHEHLSIGYFGQTNIGRLAPSKTIEEEIRDSNPMLSRTQVRGICGAMMFSGDKAEKKISVLSGGEKSRVLLGKLLANRSNLLLLDEPTSHLDIQSVEALVAALKEFNGGVIIVTHSEMILRALCDSLVVFSDRGVEFFDGDYEDFLDRRGWDGEETAGPSKRREKAVPTPAPNKNNKPQSSNSKGNWKIRKLEEEFEEVSQKLKENAASLEVASSNGEVSKIVELAAKRDELEARQLVILESIENSKK